MVIHVKMAASVLLGVAIMDLPANALRDTKEWRALNTPVDQR